MPGLQLFSALGPLSGLLTLSSGGNQMALVKPTYITSLGFHQEIHPSNDSIELGGLGMNGEIDMNAHKVIDLLQASAVGDALGWGQNAEVVDFQVTGVMLADLDMDSHKVTNLLQASAAGDALAWGQDASVVNLTVTSGLAADLSAASFKITNLATCTASADAANKGYVDSVAQGLDVKKSVRAVAISNVTLSGTQTIDGVSLVAGDRVLCMGQTASADNGIYVVAAGAWSRADDADGSDLNPGAFTFVEEGTVYHDCGFVMTADEPFTLGTTAQTWVQFSKAGVLNPRHGLSLNGLDIDVDTGAGIEIDGSDAVAISLATDPGLQFTANKLDLKLANADTLSKSAAGLDVEGVNLNFKIDGVATSSDVTSANLGTLTAGILSDASSLHNHQQIEMAFTAAAGLAAGDAVYLSTANTVAESDAATDSKRWVMGVARSVAGGSAQIVSRGLCPGVLSGATAGDRYYVQTAGGIGNTIPGVGENMILVGVAANATDLFVHIIDQGKRAA